MKTGKASGKPRGSDAVFRIVKAALLAAVITVILVLVYAWVLQQGFLGVDSIPIVNSVLKVIGAILAAAFATRRRQGRRWLVGGTAGLAYILLSFAVFSIAADNFRFGMGIFSDLLMGVLAGMITGMLIQLRK